MKLKKVYELHIRQHKPFHFRKRCGSSPMEPRFQLKGNSFREGSVGNNEGYNSSFLEKCFQWNTSQHQTRNEVLEMGNFPLLKMFRPISHFKGWLRRGLQWCSSEVGDRCLSPKLRGQWIVFARRRSQDGRKRAAGSIIIEGERLN